LKRRGIKGGEKKKEREGDGGKFASREGSALREFFGDWILISLRLFAAMIRYLQECVLALKAKLSNYCATILRKNEFKKKLKEAYCFSTSKRDSVFVN
jgi:hypothetical protein